MMFIFNTNKKRLILTAFITVILLASAVQNIFAEAKRISPLRQKFINNAMTHIGVPYEFGGKDYPKHARGFDCSGFVTFTIRETFCSQEVITEQNAAAAKTIDRIISSASAQALYERTEKIEAKEREPGDLIFFSETKDSRKKHVGIYLGIYHSTKGLHPDFEGRPVFISAVSDGPKTGVVIRPVDEKYWREHHPVYTRFIKSSKDAPRVTDKK